MKTIVRRIATSCIPIVLVILIYAFLPSVNPEVKDVQGFGAKLQAGKQELDKEIESDLKASKKKLIRLRKAERNQIRSPNRESRQTEEPVHRSPNG